MKNEKLMPGIILVIIGAVFLLNNYDVINFHWSNLWHFWPVFLIMGGINLLFAGNRAPWATAIKIAVVVIGLGIVIFAPARNYHFFGNHSNMRFDDNDDDDDDDDDNIRDKSGITKVEGSSTFSEPFTADVTIAKLDISGGGTSYKLKDTTSDLFKANTKEFYSRYIYNKNMEGTVPVLSLHMKNNNKNSFQWDSDKNNSADIMLNTKPIWDVRVNAGATELDFDLSKFKIRNVDINGGAGSFHIKLGQPLAATEVDVKTGVSEVEIMVPQNSACKIAYSSGLSSSDFEGFDKNSDNTYQTPGFDKAATKTTIHIKGGLSDIKVIRY
jgi:hypothetical protein